MSLFKTVASVSQPAAGSSASAPRGLSGGAARDSKPLLWPYVMSGSTYNKTIVPGDNIGAAPTVDQGIQNQVLTIG